MENIFYGLIKMLNICFIPKFIFNSDKYVCIYNGNLFMNEFKILKF